MSWDKFDNAVLDMWKLLAPASVNFIVVSIVFYPVFHNAFLGDRVGEVDRNNSKEDLTADIGNTADYLQDVLDVFGKNLSEIPGYALIVLVSLAVLVFVTNRLTLLVSRVFLGDLNFREDRMGGATSVREILLKSSIFVPIRRELNSPDSWWDFVKNSNDSGSSVGLYTERRDSIVEKKNRSRLAFGYFSSYFVLSVVSLVIVIVSENVSGFKLLLTGLLLVSGFFAFLSSYKYYDDCTRLVKLDFTQFVNCCIRDGSQIFEERLPVTVADGDRGAHSVFFKCLEVNSLVGFGLLVSAQGELRSVVRNAWANLKLAFRKGNTNQDTHQ